MSVSLGVSALISEGVSVRYGEGSAARQAVDDVHLTFHSGTVSLVKGPSGCGKTTLLSVLGGLLKPYAGRVRVNGDDLYAGDDRASAAWRRRFFGFVFQSCQLFPALTALENVRIPLDLRGDACRRGEMKAHDLLNTVGLAGRGAARPRELSGGEQQRVAIARALATDPAIILADEPTAALDAANGRGVAELLTRIAHEFGRTVVMVSHDDRLVEFADRIIGLADGVVVADQVRSVA